MRDPVDSSSNDTAEAPPVEAIIASLGSTVSPIVVAIARAKPSWVVFVASQGSVQKVGETMQALREQGVAPRTETVLTDDPDDLVACYSASIKAAEILQHKSIPPERVAVAFTGGTKPMSAGLVLATVSCGFSFTYVGGGERTKEGLGVVVDGAEQVVSALSPWEVFAVQEKRAIGQEIAARRYPSAATRLRDAAKRQPQPALRRTFEAVAETCDGYDAWDRFDHVLAKKALDRGAELVRAVVEFTGEQPLARFLQQVDEDRRWLGELLRETRGGKEPAPRLVVDLVANAARRANEGRHDDAVARLYRALELCIQIAFKVRFKCSTSEVNVEALPGALQEPYRLKYGDERGAVKIGLAAAGQALVEAATPFGQLYSQYQEQVLKLLSTRNTSILAHGLQPITNEQRSSLGRQVEVLLDDTDISKPHFPTLEW